MKLTFSHRIIAGFLVMAALSVLIGYLTFVTTKNIQRVTYAIMKENVSSLKAAEELELALLNQKGLVASYFLDGQHSWLGILEDKKVDFDIWFKKASSVALTSSEREILKEISFLYKTYNSQRNKAIRFYQLGNVSEAKRILLNDMKNSVDSLYQRCEDLILANEMLIAYAETSSQKRVFKMTSVIWITIAATLFLGGFMGFLFAKKINEQLARSAKMATLGQLSANIAHEIRNPLTSIKMRLFSLEEGLKDHGSAREDLGIISEEINRMEKTVKNFLDFSRPPEPDLKRCDMCQILEKTIGFLLPRASAQNIRIKKEFFNELSHKMNADKEQIQQVFLNIMLNAIEAMPRGGSIEISTARKQDKKLKDVLEIKIADTGLGMSPEVKRHLFEPFFTTKTEGTGLGLLVSSKIIQMHKGRIEIDSQPGKGTIVAIKLPYG